MENHSFQGQGRKWSEVYIAQNLESFVIAQNLRKNYAKLTFLRNKEYHILICVENALNTENKATTFYFLVEGNWALYFTSINFALGFVLPPN